MQNQITVDIPSNKREMANFAIGPTVTSGKSGMVYEGNQFEVHPAKASIFLNSGVSVKRGHLVSKDAAKSTNTTKGLRDLGARFFGIRAKPFLQRLMLVHRNAVTHKHFIQVYPQKIHKYK